MSDVPTIVPEGAVFPSTVSAFKFVTFVVEATVNGAVPVEASNAEDEPNVLFVKVWELFVSTKVLLVGIVVPSKVAVLLEVNVVKAPVLVPVFPTGLLFTVDDVIVLAEILCAAKAVTISAPPTVVPDGKSSRVEAQFVPSQNTVIVLPLRIGTLVPLVVFMFTV